MRIHDLEGGDLRRMLLRGDRELTLYPDSGHGSLFQYPDWFLNDTLRFLERD